MEDIERFIKIMQQRRFADQCKLKSLDAESDEYKKLMKELQNLRREREQCKESITKHLNMITAHKHSIHKIVHSSKNISGLPVPHDYAQDVTTMFTDSIEFLNNVGNINKTLSNVKENVDPLKIIQAVTTCTEAAGNELYETRCNIAQLSTLKENIEVLRQYILNNNDSIEDESLIISGESTDSQSTIK